MRAIVGYGNTLRGEDGFGVEVIQRLQNYTLKETKLIEVFQLTPELCLELLECDEILFVDAVYMENCNYSLIVPLYSHTDINLSHHISPMVIISLLQEVYKKTISYCIYSMATTHFDTIVDKKRYDKNIQTIVEYLK